MIVFRQHLTNLQQGGRLMNSERRPGGGPSGSADVLTRAARKPDLVVRYGDEAGQVADVHVPEGAAHRNWTGERAPLAIFLHGGFWRAEYGREHTGPLADGLSQFGFVVCAPEYRRSGQQGGGWPGTFDDVALAADRLPRLVAKATHGLVDPDPAGTILAGHSAGGHLALWAASRHRLPHGSRWRTEPQRWRGVVALAAVSDLWACYRKGLGDGAAAALMGGGPADFADNRYREADPMRLVPAGAQVWLLHGLEDDRVPFPMMLDYAREARATGIPAAGATCVLLPGAGHFELIDPLSAEWEQVVDAFRHVGRVPSG
jgi:acetyl esterase/lipase